MKTILEQLENNEAILLMYLAGELPDCDRAEVDQMLTRDPALRLELEQLAALHCEMQSMLSLEGTDRSDARREAVVRRTAPPIHQFAASRRQAPAQIKPTGRLRVTRWLYPVAAAAILLIGIFIWRSQQTPTPDHLPSPIPVALNAPVPEIFRSDPASGSLKDLEDQVVRLASGEDDPLGFRTVLNRQ